ncbi:hydantoinase B/oxoprolinase family protein [Fodinibius salsisoli]|uniref:Hydantoinase B/oxoprolinase family protein n=1 Tax=Fodinibius salsisoli TaxID=2820877 RepID=A0ABT3PTC3_9BACT|nr:hydantoinase B/oxoprolinase family protein [Fodinibius salsisoli]MCW9709092.1 hydantoinase B/oxoprolinase family protein [Fodinibius salsisoli]
MNNSEKPWSIYIDTGGTFTDCIAVTPDGNQKKVKVLSSSALRGKIVERRGTAKYKIKEDWEAPDGFIRGFHFSLLDNPEITRKVTAYHAEEAIIELDEPFEETGSIAAVSFEVKTEEEAPILATRLITETPVGRPLPPMDLRLATTKGTNALLEEKGGSTILLVTEGYRDLLTIGNQQRPNLFALRVEKTPPIYDEVIEVPERLSAEGEVLKRIDLTALEAKIDRLSQQDIQSVAVALLHSHKNDIHEQELKKWLMDKGFSNVSVSSELSPFIGIIPRAETTLVNAYLEPIIQSYLDNVATHMQEGSLMVMTSAGGLTTSQEFDPKDSLLSGPAGGVVGAASEGEKTGFDKIISFDMGGTSTDVARYNGEYEYVFEHQVGSAHLVAPSLYVETVAAGGGSICGYDGHKLYVGPESAGAYPGPACYGAGGPFTITDVNLLLGRLDPQNFHIPLIAEAADKKFRQILKKLRKASEVTIHREEVLQSFLDIANERMADAIQKISLRKGYDAHEYALASFGGAGGQHACAIARHLGMKNIVIPVEAGLLSAEGLQHARIEEFAERQVLKPLSEVYESVEGMIEELATRATEKLYATVGRDQKIGVRRKICSLRFQGQESSLDVEFSAGDDLAHRFRTCYIKQYGHWVSGRTVELESVRVVASTTQDRQETIPLAGEQNWPVPAFTKPIWFNGNKRTAPVFIRDHLSVGDCIQGPALILDPHSTIVIEPGWKGAVDARDTLILNFDATDNTTGFEQRPEAARLELFTNRFSTIATEMGEMLRRTAVSVNVKDRLDFSCALLNPEGELVVNAPHIPVHLGALGLCVRRLMETIAMEPGDVVVTNHPGYGGSHLPDVTVVTPVFTKNKQCIGYAASRAHHAEIGGLDPGSMPPMATNLAEEGVVIPPMYLIRGGEEKWQDIEQHLKEATYPSRNVEENMADLQAAVAANHRGAEGLRALAKKYGLDEVHHYMKALKQHAHSKMEDTLINIPDGEYVSEELLDDGNQLKARFQVKKNRMQIDFTGTSAVHPHNLNATPAIVNSVVMYVLRLLINEPLPLNEGILAPIDIVLPHCLLNPEFDQDPAQCPAVVGGNTEVSQRLVDTLLKPFEVVACSQGTMNNVLFGNDYFGYYETVGGGTGAGPGFHGADAVHHHMTNTKGTDPEILEYRYPVRLRRYSIRDESGGEGEYGGGNGIIREIEFLESVRLTVLTQHRLEVPYGLKGAEAGAAGEQWVHYADGSKEKLAPIDGRDLQKGDRFILKTPGGGGFGHPDK